MDFHFYFKQGYKMGIMERFEFPFVLDGVYQEDRKALLEKAWE